MSKKSKVVGLENILSLSNAAPYNHVVGLARAIFLSFQLIFFVLTSHKCHNNTKQCIFLPHCLGQCFKNRTGE